MQISIRFLIVFISLTALSFPGSFVKADIFVFYDISGVKTITNMRPDWWTDEMDTMDPMSIKPPDGSEVYPGKFVGDKENRKFHRPTCEQIYTPDKRMAIPESKIIWFNTVDEALSQGFFSCDHCKPAENDPAAPQ